MILDGRKIAAEIREDLAKKIWELSSRPKLVVILLGESPASLAYIKQKRNACQEVWIEFELRQFDPGMNELELLAVIQELNHDTTVSGYIVQLPLPSHIDEKKINEAIDPRKDVDGFTPYNIGSLILGTDHHLDACTPKGIIRILEYHKILLRGKNVTIIGRSNIVGKPLAIMFINAGATVTICNSQTKNLANKTREADIIVCAAGKPHLLTEDMVTPGSIIIDVGITKVDDRIVWDADYINLVEDNMITPVPGWVGPMTVAMLLENTYLAHIS